jgi:phage gp29-like protein
LAGQTVTTDGGSGFANASIHAAIRSDLIKATADALAYTLNTQVLPYYFAVRFGVDLDTVDLSQSPQVEWDVTPAADRTREAAALQTTADAIGKLVDALAKAGLTPDVRAIAAQYGIPLTEPSKPVQAVLSLVPGGQT